MSMGRHFTCCELMIIFATSVSKAIRVAYTGQKTVTKVWCAIRTITEVPSSWNITQVSRIRQDCTDREVETATLRDLFHPHDVVDRIRPRLYCAWTSINRIGTGSIEDETRYWTSIIISLCGTVSYCVTIKCSSCRCTISPSHNMPRKTSFDVWQASIMPLFGSWSDAFQKAAG